MRQNSPGLKPSVISEKPQMLRSPASLIWDRDLSNGYALNLINDGNSAACRAGAEGEEVSRSPWTTHDDEQLRKLARAGLSLSELAHKLDRSISSVRTRALKLDIAIARDINSMQRIQRRSLAEEKGK